MRVGKVGGLGTEFSASPVLSAAAISVRFPRIVGRRDDKNWKYDNHSSISTRDLHRLVEVAYQFEGTPTTTKHGKAGAVVDRSRALLHHARPSFSTSARVIHRPFEGRARRSLVVTHHPRLSRIGRPTTFVGL